MGVLDSSLLRVIMTLRSSAGLAICLGAALLMCSTASHQPAIKRIEIDLLRLMNGDFAPTTLTTTLTLNNGTAFAVFAGDSQSDQLDTVYLMLANASKYIVEVQLDKAGTSRLSTYWAPHNKLSSTDGAIKFFLNSNSTWVGNATIKLPPIGGDMTYAMAARLSGGDPEDCSSYLGSYWLQNAAVGTADRHVLDLYNSVDGGW